MSSAQPASLNPEEIIATLNRQIERYEALAAGSRRLGSEDDAEQALATVVKLRAVRDEFLAWLVARAYRRPPQTGQVFIFRNRKVADSAA